MSAANPVPSDVEADTIIDLVQDCREVSGLLGSFVPTVLPGVLVLPEPRDPSVLEIDDAVVAGLDGWGSYGS